MPMPQPSMSSTDVENFTKANPADGARLSALRSTGTMVWAGALISSIGSMGWVMKSRGPSIGLPVAAIVGGMVGFLVADEVPHLFYGLYGFNHAAVNANFAKWKKEQQ